MIKILRTYGAVLLAMIFWSLSYIWFKIANEEYRPMTIVFLRLLISATLLSLYLLFTGRFEKIRKQDWIYFISMAFCEPFLYFIGESNGLTYITSTTGSVLIATIPLFAALAGWIFFRERLSALNYSGIILSFAGIIIFVFNRDGTLSFNPMGLLLMLLAVLSALSYSLILKKLAGSYHPVFIVNIQNIIGIIFFIPVILFSELRHISSFDFNYRAFLPIVEMAIFASSGSFILFGFAVRKLGVTRANVFSNSIPVFTAAFAFLMLEERLALQNMIGMIIVISGLFLSQYNKTKRPSLNIVMPLPERREEEGNN